MVFPSDGDARDEVPRGAPTAADDASSLSATDVCQYLLVPEAGIRYGHPDREHRCLATRPHDSITQDKQRRLCLTADHATCPAFQAARERRLAMLAESGIPMAALESGQSRPLERTAPLVLETGNAPFGRAAASVSDVSGPGRPEVRSAAGADLSRRIAGTAGRRGTTDRGWHAVAGPGLALIVVIAALAVVAARFPGPARPAGAGESQTPASSVLASSTLASSAPSPPSATPIPTPAATPTQSLSAPTAAASESAQGARTYRVKSGDTVSAIAARFGVSVAAIQQLNGIKEPRLLQVGQVLRIP
jgi:LysM repeat protein